MTFKKVPGEVKQCASHQRANGSACTGVSTWVEVLEDGTEIPTCLDWMNDVRGWEQGIKAQNSLNKPINSKL